MVLLTIAICTVSSAPIKAFGSAKSCSVGEQRAADALYDRLDNWAQIEVMFDRFHQCDDGGIAEGNSEAVTRMLIEHWETLPDLDNRARRDFAFRHWVLGHIDGTLALDGLRKIDEQAKLSCPPHHSALCKDVRRAVARAINDN